MIAAVDNKRGIANEHGIPWNLPSDVAYFREKTKGARVVMGFGVYKELQAPLPDRENYVLTRDTGALRDGFLPVTDLSAFLEAATEDLWVIGGAVTYELALPYADELYLTELEQDFHCTKFFPEFAGAFELLQESEPQIENGITFRYRVYGRKN